VSLLLVEVVASVVTVRVVPESVALAEPTLVPGPVVGEVVEVVGSPLLDPPVLELWVAIVVATVSSEQATQKVETAMGIKVRPSARMGPA